MQKDHKFLGIIILIFAALFLCACEPNEQSQKDWQSFKNKVKKPASEVGSGIKILQKAICKENNSNCKSLVSCISNNLPTQAWRTRAAKTAEAVQARDGEAGVVLLEDSAWDIIVTNPRYRYEMELCVQRAWVAEKDLPLTEQRSVPWPGDYRRTWLARCKGDKCKEDLACLEKNLSFHSHVLNSPNARRITKDCLGHSS